MTIECKSPGASQVGVGGLMHRLKEEMSMNSYYREHAQYKASELVPCSLLPHWNSNAIFRDGFPLRLDLTAGSKIRDPVTAKFKHARLL